MTDFDFYLLIGISVLLTFFVSIAVFGYFHLKWYNRKQERLKQAAMDQD